VPTRRKLRQRSGNMRGAGARSSYEWQKSIGRIARLVRREAARSRGDYGRALARRKPEAPPDAGHGWREGESVREYKQAIKSSRVLGLWVSARRFRRRRKTFSDNRPSCSHRQGDVEVLRLRGQGADTFREERAGTSASDGTEADSGVPVSDHESVRDRRDSVKAPRGPRRT